jgi:hypothetical protein
MYIYNKQDIYITYKHNKKTITYISIYIYVCIYTCVIHFLELILGVLFKALF